MDEVETKTCVWLVPPHFNKCGKPAVGIHSQSKCAYCEEHAQVVSKFFIGSFVPFEASKSGD